MWIGRTIALMFFFGACTRPAPARPTVVGDPHHLVDEAMKQIALHGPAVDEATVRRALASMREEAKRPEERALVDRVEALVDRMSADGGDDLDPLLADYSGLLRDIAALVPDDVGIQCRVAAQLRWVAETLERDVPGPVHAEAKQRLDALVVRFPRSAPAHATRAFSGSAIDVEPLQRIRDLAMCVELGSGGLKTKCAEVLRYEAAAYVMPYCAHADVDPGVRIVAESEDGRSVTIGDETVRVSSTAILTAEDVLGVQQADVPFWQIDANGVRRDWVQRRCELRLVPSSLARIHETMSRERDVGLHGPAARDLALPRADIAWRASRMVLLAGDHALAIADERPMDGILGMPLGVQHDECRALCTKSVRRELPEDVRALVGEVEPRTNAR